MNCEKPIGFLPQTFTVRAKALLGQASGECTIDDELGTA
jgi:hypothetical protein